MHMEIIKAMKYQDKVKFINAPGLTGLTGTILGIASDLYGTRTFIVGLDQPMSNFSALAITEHCLEVVKTPRPHPSLCNHNFVFVRNIYGDEMIEYNYNRSLWQCTECEICKLSRGLHCQN